MTAFKSVITDVDSTLCGVEGIDWLAAHRSAAAAAEVARLTDAAMKGEISLDEVYGRRLALVAPAKEDIDALGIEYLRTIAPGATETFAALRNAGVGIHLISGGLLPAILPVARAVGVDEASVHAVGIYFGDDGSFVSFDGDSPLTRQTGKREVIGSLDLDPPVLMVGDGMTDAEAAPVVEAFAAFTGFARREAVLARAEHVVSSFPELLTLVLG